MEVMKVLALLVVWGIPAVLVLAATVFTVLALTLAFGGLVRRICTGIKGHQCSREAGLRAQATA